MESNSIVKLVYRLPYFIIWIDLVIFFRRTVNTHTYYCSVIFQCQCFPMGAVVT